MRKILFLDIDGVLNTALFHNKVEREKMQDKYGYTFDPAAVKNLKLIFDETGAELVISSSWKYMGLAKLREMWKMRNLPGKIADITPDITSKEFLSNADFESMNYQSFRGQEINGWMMLHGKDVSHYAILDDMYDMLPEQQPHLVWIDSEVGITGGNAAQAIMILNHLKYEKEDSCNS